MRFRILGVALALVMHPIALAGDLNPPAGPVAPTPGPEPRTPIGRTTTPGDADSVYRISASGSYYLTENLTGAAGEHGLEIAADHVTIDLMGFEVMGDIGSLSGISLIGTPRSNITVTNGVVRGWGDTGVDLAAGSGARIEAIHATENGNVGIWCGHGLIVRCVAISNGNDGIAAGANGNVWDCLARNNSNAGISTGNGVVVDGCSATGNALGFVLGDGSNLSRSVSHQNLGIGIVAFDRCVITSCASTSNTGSGIQVSDDCVVRGNVCAGNTGGGAGIHVLASDNRVEENSCTDNAIGIDVDAPGNIIIRNTCATNTTNYDFVANNLFGPIIDRTAPASGAVSGNAAASSLGSTDPNANFTY